MRIISQSLFIALFGIVLVTGCNKDMNTTSTGNAVDAKNAVATVNGSAISKELFDAYTKQRAAARPEAATPDDPKAVMDELVSREVIYQDALKQGLDKNPEVTAQVENLRRNIVANEAIRKHLESHVLTDEEMKKEYESNIGSMGGKEYKAKHVLVKTEQEAKDIIAQLDKGADFAAIAKEKSVDTASGKDGGDLGWFDASQMVKPFADAVASMEKGTYGKTPTQSQFGWHVILLEDTREIKPPAFEQVKESVRGIMRNKQIKDYLDQLKAKAKVDVKTANAAPAAANATPAAGGGTAPSVSAK